MMITGVGRNELPPPFEDLPTGAVPLCLRADTSAFWTTSKQLVYCLTDAGITDSAWRSWRTV